MTERIQVDENIVLKRIGINDADTIFNIIDSERDYLGKWLPFVKFTTCVNDSLEFIDLFTNPMTEDTPFGIWNENNLLIGLIGLKDTDYDNLKTEIGYWLSEKYQNKGIMTRSCRALIRYAFETLGLNRIQIKTAVGNTSSQKVPARLGFTHEGIERAGEKHGDKYLDLNTFSLLRDEFIHP